MTEESERRRAALFALVARIPRGKVSTYGEMGRALGFHARLVGRLLHTNADPLNTPCHRIVRSTGELAGGYAFGGPNIQKNLLESEGISFTNREIDLKTFGWEAR
ncbi:MAG: MGMT family protein [Candidatus Pacebacteria bacterium]|nr:MGMT family protein [Candidatus Paceibacterota bacterium]PIR61026.1 MAG: cysteine methyltransferase [Candidatus Pacebacteria bacterium CG10_big_fil_rev_8_21_14_0_10_45_6]